MCGGTYKKYMRKRKKMQDWIRVFNHLIALDITQVSKYSGISSNRDTDSLLPRTLDILINT